MTDPRGGGTCEAQLGLALTVRPLAGEGVQLQDVKTTVNRPHPPNPPANESFDAKAKARFWKKVSPAPSNACWIWRGAANQRGYGNVGREGRTYLAHRVAYELTYGPVPAGMDIDHLCRTTSCVNPEHLEPVTFLANMRRRYAENPDERSTHCLSGHELTPENTLQVLASGQRRCRTCVTERGRAS